MVEDHRCQSPTLCVDNCGFFGSPTTQNLCSKCYRDEQHKEQQAITLRQTFVTSSTASSSTVSVSSPQPKVVEETNSTAVQANRCTTCRRRVGLTGFKCRCGMTYCGSHRYPEHHACRFDFKSVGKEQIAKVNPVIKGEKLQKI